VEGIYLEFIQLCQNLHQLLHVDENQNHLIDLINWPLLFRIALQNDHSICIRLLKRLKNPNYLTKFPAFPNSIVDEDGRIRWCCGRFSIINWFIERLLLDGSCCCCWICCCCCCVCWFLFVD